MEIPKFEAYLPTDLQCIYWSQNAVYWAGRLWTFCSSSLHSLINQVTTATFEHFAPSPTPSHTPSPAPVSLEKRKFQTEDLVKDNNSSDENLDLSFLFGTNENLNPKSSPSTPRTPSPSPKVPKKRKRRLSFVTPVPNEPPKQVEESKENYEKKRRNGKRDAGKD